MEKVFQKACKDAKICLSSQPEALPVPRPQREALPVPRPDPTFKWHAKLPQYCQQIQSQMETTAASKAIGGSGGGNMGAKQIKASQQSKGDQGDEDQQVKRSKPVSKAMAIKAMNKHAHRVQGPEENRLRPVNKAKAIKAIKAMKTNK